MSDTSFRVSCDCGSSACPGGVAVDVVKAAEILDKIFADDHALQDWHHEEKWYNEVDLSILDMTSLTKCVFGQLFKRWDYAPQLLMDTNAFWPDSSVQEAWVKAITERRNKDA